MTAIFAMQSFRVQSQTAMVWLSGSAIPIEQTDDGEIGDEGEKPDCTDQFSTRYCRRDRMVDRANGDPQAEQFHDAALEQRETDHRESNRVIRGISEKIEGVGAQADGTGDDAGDDLNEKHRNIHRESSPQYPPIALVGLWRRAVVVAAGHQLCSQILCKTSTVRCDSDLKRASRTR